MTLTIIEVVERSIQGRTRPYICRADDGEFYYVKGRSATRSGLIAEWLCAELAKEFGLPIAPYALASVPDDLLEADATGWLRDLGGGIAFASQKVNAVEISAFQRVRTARATRQDVLVFDWWVRNGDRTLTELGGNPNLLCRHDDHSGLVVIDHNLAFDADFSIEAFRTGHVFADEIPDVFSDFVARESYARRLQAALGRWQQACAMIPPCWNFVDPEMTVPNDFSMESALELLRRCERPEFWNLES